MRRVHAPEKVRSFLNVILWHVLPAQIKVTTPMFVFCFLIFMATACSGPDPVAIAVKGVSVGKILDDMEDKAQVLTGQAAGAASLVSAKAARDAELLIQAARQEMHEELDDSWDTVDKQKRSILVELYNTLQGLDKGVVKAGELKDGTVLDINAAIDRLPFAKFTPMIQRVEGASQFYLDDGLYRVTIFSNFADTNRNDFHIFVGDEKTSLGSDQLAFGSAHKVSITLRNDELRFKNFDMAQVPVHLVTYVPNRRYWFQFWKSSKPRKVELSFTLELFPKFPVQYSLIEKDLEDKIDTEHVKTQVGAISTVPGCGNDGCNAWQQVCTNLIEPGAPLRISSYFDTFNGAWGGFEPNKNVITSTGMCSVFYQHSHNVARNVSFNVDYYPIIKEPVPHFAKLEPVTLGKVDEDLESSSIDTNAPCTASEKSSIKIRVPQVTFGGFFSASFSYSDIKIAEINIDKGLCSNDKPIKYQKVGWVRFGRTYSAQFKPSMSSYILVARFFNGHEEVWPSKDAPLLLVTDKAETNDKSALIQIKEPW